MYAIVDIAGQQYKVEKDQKVFVHRIKGEEGSKVDFNKVLLIDNDSKVVVGTPVIEGALVSAKIIGHLKGDTVIVFKKKKRKGYQKSNGHRQYLSQLVIEDIIEKGAKSRPDAEKKEAKSTGVKQKAVTETAVQAVPETKEAAAKKPAVAKKPTVAKKPAVAKKPTVAAGNKTATTAKKAATAKKPAASKPKISKKDTK